MQEMQETQVPYLGGGNGNPLQYSCWDSAMDRGAWKAIVLGVADSDVTEHNMRFIWVNLG